MMTITHNPIARQITINTDQGMIVIDECQNPNVTRIVISADNNGLITNHEGGLKTPVMLCMWQPVVFETLGSMDATQEMGKIIIDDEVKS